MLITFKSPASSDVMMFGDIARQMMGIIGKEVTDKGIITVEQLRWFRLLGQPPGWNKLRSVVG